MELGGCRRKAAATGPFQGFGASASVGQSADRRKAGALPVPAAGGRGSVIYRSLDRGFLVHSSETIVEGRKPLGPGTGRAPPLAAVGALADGAKRTPGEARCRRLCGGRPPKLSFNGLSSI